MNTPDVATVYQTHYYGDPGGLTLCVGSRVWSWMRDVLHISPLSKYTHKYLYLTQES